jgi:16S rRNA (cytosine967-C5)-methyltransferase
VAWTKAEEDIRKLSGLQTRLLDKAASLLKPGGRLVYCTCSLEADEGERQAEDFLARHPAFTRKPITPDEIGGWADCITPQGDVRTLPFHLALAHRPDPEGRVSEKWPRFSAADDAPVQEESIGSIPKVEATFGSDARAEHDRSGLDGFFVARFVHNGS